MQSKSEQANGYSTTEIGRLAKMTTNWSKKQDVFAFFISGAKERNPAAAMALQEKLGVTPKTSREADDLGVAKSKNTQTKKPAAKAQKKPELAMAATKPSAPKKKK